MYFGCDSINNSGLGHSCVRNVSISCMYLWRVKKSKYISNFYSRYVFSVLFLCTVIKLRQVKVDKKPSRLITWLWPASDIKSYTLTIQVTAAPQTPRMILYILPLLFYSVSGQGIFNVVRFPNTACGSANNFNGTCYTAEECSSRGGSSSGTCASGFGVCCVFSLACGGSTNANTSYATITSFTATSDRDPCTYTYCKCSDDVCKLRKVKGGEKKRIFFNLLELTLRRWLLRDHRRFLMLTLLLGWLLMLLMWSQTATMQGTAPLTLSQVTNPPPLPASHE